MIFLPEAEIVRRELDRDVVGRKIKGVVHWVCAKHAVAATVRVYDRLVSHESPASLDNMAEGLNPHSLEILQAKCEPLLSEAKSEEHFQFSRVGYFVADQVDHEMGEKLVFNQVVPLRSVWESK